MATRPAAITLAPQIKHAVRRLPAARAAIWRFRRLRHPAWLGTVRRTTPLSDVHGFDRGTPVDRYYLDQFLGEHGTDIHGRVLEVKDSGCTDRFGRNVQQREVLDIDPANPQATIVADLAAADSIPSASFDCFILVHTLQYIYDVRAALTHAHRILRPGGVLLVAVPCNGRLSTTYDGVNYSRFTPEGVRLLFQEVFGEDADLTVRSYGNALVLVASIMGMARQELSREELAVDDPCFPLLISVRAQRSR